MKTVLKTLITLSALFLCFEYLNWAFECMNYPSDLVNYLAIFFILAIPSTLIFSNKLINKIHHEKTK